VRRTALALFGLLILTIISLGCAGSGGDVAKREEVARQEAQRMQTPDHRLSTYARFELLPAVRSASIEENEDKVVYANKLEGLLADQLGPLFKEWASGGSGSGALQVQPEFETIKIVSGGARFWAGAMAGNSTIDISLVLIDAESGDVIAKPRVMRSSAAMAGGWSVGATDQNLLYYIADIAEQYMVANY
jgi:hypothetical protein